MRKNKFRTIALTGVVAVVWGMIIYRVFGSLNNDEGDTSALPAVIKEETRNDYSIPNDTIHLSLDYRNPFETLKKAPFSIAKTDQKHHAAARTAVKHAPLPSVNEISYDGYVRNAVTKKLIAVLTMNGKGLMLAEGESSGSIKLLKNMRYSVEIFYQGRPQILPLKTYRR